MNHDLLKAVIYDQHEVIRNAHIIPRDYSFEENGNYILVGLRRAGKSTMLYKIALDFIASGFDWNQIIYINFEDERLSEFRLEDFNDILSVQSELSGKKGIFFLDEIQNISGWEKFARRIADAKEHVYITGSNAKMLSSELSTTLGGRYFTKYISPYSFDEYLNASDIPHSDKELLAARSNGVIRSCCRQYLEYGGLPETLLYKSKREYISSVYQKVLLGDIVTRNSIRNEYAVRLMIKKLAESVCSDISYSRLHNLMSNIGIRAAKDTIIDYINYAENAYLIFRINNYYANFAERESNSKYYFADNGILNLFLNNGTSALLENITALALISAYHENVYYLKSSKTGIDIDFYIPDEGMAVQAAYSISGEARRRELENLKKLFKLSSDVRKLIVVTYEEEEHITDGDIHIDVIPLYKFLLWIQRNETAFLC